MSRMSLCAHTQGALKLLPVLELSFKGDARAIHALPLALDERSHDQMVRLSLATAREHAFVHEVGDDVLDINNAADG